MERAEQVRAFAVDGGGIASVLVGGEARVAAMGVSPGLSAAYDVLDDASELTEGRLKLVVAAERDGQDPEAFARHLLKLVRAVRPGDRAQR